MSGFTKPEEYEISDLIKGYAAHFSMKGEAIDDHRWIEVLLLRRTGIYHNTQTIQSLVGKF